MKYRVLRDCEVGGVNYVAGDALPDGLHPDVVALAIAQANVEAAEVEPVVVGDAEAREVERDAVKPDVEPVATTDEVQS